MLAGSSEIDMGAGERHRKGAAGNWRWGFWLPVIGWCVVGGSFRLWQNQHRHLAGVARHSRCELHSASVLGRIVHPTTDPFFPVSRARCGAFGSSDEARIRVHVRRWDLASSAIDSSQTELN